MRRATKAGEHKTWTIEKFNLVRDRLQLFHVQADTILRYMLPSATGVVSREFHRGVLRTISERLRKTAKEWDERSERDINEVAEEEGWSQDCEPWEDTLDSCSCEVKDMAKWIDGMLEEKE